MVFSNRLASDALLKCLRLVHVPVVGCPGDTIARMMEYCGAKLVSRVSHVGDLGRPVALVMAAMEDSGRFTSGPLPTPDDLSDMYVSAKQRWDAVDAALAASAKRQAAAGGGAGGGGSGRGSGRYVCRWPIVRHTLTCSRSSLEYRPHNDACVVAGSIEAWLGIFNGL